MNWVQTVLIFLGIPAGIFLVVSAMVYAKTATTHTSRYRPGRPWTYPPVWYLPHPEAGSAPRNSSAVAALSPAAAVVASAEAERMGGASGEW